MKKALGLIGIFFIVALVFMTLSPQEKTVDDKTPFIAVSSFALYDIARHMVQDKVEIRLLMPFGVDAHSYMPSVKTMQDQIAADLFFYNGLNLEPWINSDLSQGVDMSQSVSLLKVEDEHDHEEEAHHHEESEYDPHYWLNIQNMLAMLDVMKEKLVAKYPQFVDDFKHNATLYREKLEVLDARFVQGLAQCAQREIVVNHNAFAYLSKAYHFETHTLRGLSSDEQVSAKKMGEITDLIHDEGITTIFFEDFASPKVAQTIAAQTGIAIESLQPLANVTEEEAAKGYILLMNENLRKLQKAMQCQ